MAERKDILEDFKEYPNDVNLSNGIPDDAKGVLCNKKETVIRPKKRWHAVVSYLVACCVLLFVVIVPVALSPKSEKNTIYYSESLTSVVLKDIDQFVSDENLSIHYFQEAVSVENKLYTIIESGENAYIVQDIFLVEDSGFVTITIYICVSPYKYQIFDTYDELSSNKLIDSSEVYYKVVDTDLVMAKFVDDDIRYYMSIKTTNPDGALEKYVGMLLD